MALLRFPRWLPSLRTREGVEWLILLACVVLFGGAFFYTRYLEYQIVEAREQERLQRQLVLIESNLVPPLQIARRALGTIASNFDTWVREDGGQRMAVQRVRLIAETLAGVHAILVVDAQGRVIAASNDRLVGGANVPSQHVVHALEGLRKHFSPGVLHVVPPFQMGETTVAGLYRTITDSRGGFGGIVLACIDMRYLETLLDAARYAPDVWSYLADGNGTLFLVYPHRIQVHADVLDDPRSFFSQHMRSGQMISVFRGIALVTGQHRTIALRTVYPIDAHWDKPLVVSVSRDTAAVFAPWKDATRVQAGIFTLLVLIGGTGLAMYQRRQRKADMLALRQQQSLQVSEALQSAIFDSSPDALLVVDTHDIVTMTNRQVEAVLGYSGNELIGQPIDILIPQRYRAMHAQRKDAFADYRMSVRMGQGVDVRALRRDGSECEVEIRISRIDTPLGRYFVCSLRDQSERKAAQEELRIAAVAFESQEALVVTDRACRILRVNQAFTRITGFSAEEALGRNPNLLKSGRHGPEFYRAMWNAIQETGSWQGEIWGRRKNGELYPKWLTISAVRGEDGHVTHYVGAHYDMTAHKQAEAKIKELAFYDQLTGLPNRTLLSDRLRQTMATCLRDGTWGALLVIDLDNFKALNDTLGHERGDSLLKLASSRLTACVGEGDTVARVGGDEFVVVLAGRHRKMVDAASATEAMARKMLSALDEPYAMDGTVHHNTASIGITLLGGDVVSTEERMKQAELAMYRSKEDGRNSLRFFDPSMERAIHVRVALEKDLREALESRKFQLYYQAQTCDDGMVVGAEVLLRWQHPLRGWISPASFIPLAEETGLILPLGQWVLDTVCAQLAVWGTDPLFANLTVAVNVSAMQFQQADFVDRVLATVRNHAANPKRLKIELTETLFVEKVEEIVQKMYQLKGHGIGFALDDFGTGYSSLSYLKRLPLDQLKIDQSFVRDVLVDPNDAAIARTIVALAESLGLGVIAEGVETQAQREALSHSGCRMYQGYLFSRPIPLGEFEEFVRSRSQGG